MAELKGMLGLARKAGALTCGTNNVLSAVRSGKAKVVLIAADASEGTRKMLCDKAAWRSIPTYNLPFSMQQLAAILGKSECAAAAVTTQQFADFYYSVTEGSTKEAGKYGDNK